MRKRIIALLMSSIILFTGCTNGGKDVIESGKIYQTEWAESMETISAETFSVSEEEPSAMVELTSQELVNNMKIGWNLGNTLDVCQADRDGDGIVNEHVAEGEEVDETLWGNPYATKELFKALVDDGVNAVRIPITWRDHIDEQGEIDESWKNRVKQVVNYAYSLGMYVIINIHHDGGSDEQFGAWLGKAVTDYDSTIARYKKLWAQIAAMFKNYNERLIFESMNEVGFDSLGEGEAYALLNSINQEFVDLIRASGGNNGSRHLLIAGYWTDIEKTCDSRFVMPTDPAGRCIVSVHYYTPWQFCTTNIQNEWGTAAEQQQMEILVSKMKTTFVDNGIPVIIGEYAASGNDLDSVLFFCEKFVKMCSDYGMATFLWDNGEQVNRSTYEWRTPQLLQVLQRAVSGEDYTPARGDYAA